MSFCRILVDSRCHCSTGSETHTYTTAASSTLQAILVLIRDPLQLKRDFFHVYAHFTGYAGYALGSLQLNGLSLGNGRKETLIGTRATIVNDGNCIYRSPSFSIEVTGHMVC